MSSSTTGRRSTRRRSVTTSTAGTTSRERSSRLSDVLLAGDLRWFKKNEELDLSPSLYKSCKAKGTYTAVHAGEAVRPFIPALSLTNFGIASPTALKKYGANKAEIRDGVFTPTGTYGFKHPTGTGPFKFKSWTVGEKLEIVRNNNYWGKKAKLGRVIFRPISNNTARLQALQTGEIMGYDLVAPQDYNTIKNSSGLKLLTRPAFNVAYVTMHQGPGSPMNDLKVRQAVAYGLNRKGVINRRSTRPGPWWRRSSCRRSSSATRRRVSRPTRTTRARRRPAELVELPCPVPGRLLVPVGGVTAVHA